jgi:hypothetical protein
MKSKIKWLLIGLMIVVLFSMSSCSKNPDDIKPRVEATVALGFQIAGVEFTLYISNGTGYYYPASAYNSFVYGNNVIIPPTLCYVKSKPFDSESFDVCDYLGNKIGNVRCWQGVGSQTGLLWKALQKWFDDHPGSWCRVNVEWEPSLFTHGAERKGTVKG